MAAASAASLSPVEAGVPPTPSWPPVLPSALSAAMSAAASISIPASRCPDMYRTNSSHRTSACSTSSATASTSRGSGPPDAALASPPVTAAPAAPTCDAMSPSVLSMLPVAPFLPKKELFAASSASVHCDDQASHFLLSETCASHFPA